MTMDRRTALSLMAAPLAARAATQAPAASQGESPKTPAPPPAQRPIDAPLDVVVPALPTAFQSGGRTHLVYELHLTNFGRPSCLLTRLDVVGNGRSLASYTGADFSKLIVRPGVQAKDPLLIDGGLRAVTYVWITLEPGAAVPAALDQRLDLKVGDDTEEFHLACASIPVRQNIVTIAPPLRGDNWAALNGPANASGHRRALIPVGGRTHIAQRFAIDWVRLRDEGNTYSGDRLDNKNYRAYGTEVMAVADGAVVTVKDGIPENVPGGRAVPITLETVGGNHVILDLGGGFYAFYAHLQPGKIRVKLGDHVRAGQVLALLGNSGNSTEPHLHFHICDANSPLACEGMPYLLNSFVLQGKADVKIENGAPRISIAAEGAGTRTREMVLQNEVVRFS